MTDDHYLHHSRDGESKPTNRSRLAERWNMLDPDEQALVTMAVDAMQAGEFALAHSWDRFVDASIELLPLLREELMTVEMLHELALQQARVS